MSGSGDMHHNKLEALREKENAEKMIISKDYVNAHDKLLRAQHLFPLDHITSMLTACKILSASSIHFPGYGMDHYWVLSLPPSCTISEIRHQYQKLAVLLQPIMDSFLGAALAFKLIKDSLSVLSDNDKRSAFDAQRATAWTNYELPDLVASSCASGILDYINQDFYNFDDDRKVDNLEADQIWAIHYELSVFQNRRYAKIIRNSMSKISVIWLKPIPLGDGERRWCEAGLPVACGSFCVDSGSSSQVNSPMLFSHKCSWLPGLTADQFDIYPKTGEVWALFEDWNLDEWSYNPNATKNCHFKLVEILSDFCKYSGVDCVCLLKVDGFRSVFERELQEGLPVAFHISPGKLYIFSHKVPTYRFRGGEVNGVSSGMLELDQLSLLNNIMEKLDIPAMLDMETSDGSSLTSPEEELRSNHLLNAISAGQVWAAYSGREFMPRRYVLIDDVISETHVSVSILEPELTIDGMGWKKNNLPITCGLFKIGRTISKFEVSELSHPVKYEKSISSYMIYPLKGQIWAMYQEWNSKWNQLEWENCQYSVIEIISDFSEGEKIVVKRLVEVNDFCTFFDAFKLNGFEQNREIPKAEILSFSHEIPSYKVPGIADHGIPDSSWHLEPNALPPKCRRYSDNIT